MEDHIDTWDNEGGNIWPKEEMDPNIIGNQIPKEEFPLPCDHKERTKEIHSCPFYEDVWNDNRDVCYCCDNCVRDCMNDI